MWYSAGRGRVGSLAHLHRDSWYLPIPHLLDTWCCLIRHLALVQCPQRCTASHEGSEIYTDPCKSSSAYATFMVKVFGLRLSVGHVVPHERQDPNCPTFTFTNDPSWLPGFKVDSPAFYNSFVSSPARLIVILFAHIIQRCATLLFRPARVLMPSFASPTFCSLCSASPLSY